MRTEDHERHNKELTVYIAQLWARQATRSSCVFKIQALGGIKSSIDWPSSSLFSIAINFSTPSINSCTNSRCKKHDNENNINSINNVKQY